MTGRGGSGDSIWDYLCLIKMKSGQRNYIMQQPEANHSMYRLTPKFIARNAVNRTLCQATGYSANLYLLPRKKDGRFNHYLLDHSRTLSQSAGATKYQNYTRRGKDEANQKHNTSMGGKIDIKDHTQISTIAWCWHCISHSTGNNWQKRKEVHGTFHPIKNFSLLSPHRSQSISHVFVMVTTIFKVHTKAINTK